MAVVKSPKNAKHKKLWTRKLSNSAVKNYSIYSAPLYNPSKLIKPYQKVYSWDKPARYFKKITKSSLLKNIFTI